MCIERSDIGDTLFAKVYEDLINHKCIAIMGPRHGAKSFILDRVIAIGQATRKASAPCIVRLTWDDFEQGGVFNLLSTLRTSFCITSEECVLSEDDFCTSFQKLVRTALDNNLHSDIWLFLQDLIGFPRFLVSQILRCVEWIYSDPDIGSRIGTIITGSADLHPLCEGTNAPLNGIVMTSYITTRMDLHCALHYFYLRRRIALGDISVRWDTISTDECYKTEIRPDAFQWLYQLTAGAPHSIQSLISATGRHRPDSREFELSRPWELEPTKQYIRDYVYYFMPEDQTIRQSLRDIESNRSWFDLLVAIIKSQQGSKVVIQDGVNVTLKSLHPLEIDGIIKRSDSGNPQIFSEMLLQYIDRTLSPRHIADVFALQGRWDEAWEEYQSPDAFWRRPLSGAARTRLQGVIKNWRNHLTDSTHESVAAVIKHFIEGSKYLFGFNEVGLYDQISKQWIDGSSIKEPALEPCELPDDLPEADLEGNIALGAKNLIDNSRKQVWSLSNLPSPFAHRAAPALYLKRTEFENAIDISEQRQLWEAIDKFWAAYEKTEKREWAACVGDIPQRHIMVLDAVNALLLRETFTQEEVVKYLAEVLGKKGGYYRVLICLVDKNRQYIEAVASYCQDNTLKPRHEETRHLLWRPGQDVAQLDIQPWVVKTSELKTISDASSPENLNPTTNIDQSSRLHMKAITVVPLKVGNDVIGTFHIELPGLKPIAQEAEELLRSMAGPIAVIIRHAQTVSAGVDLLFNMLSDMRHEFRTPIGVLGRCLLDYRDALINGDIDTLQKLLPQMQTQVRRLQKRSKDYQDFLTPYHPVYRTVEILAPLQELCTDLTDALQWQENRIKVVSSVDVLTVNTDLLELEKLVEECVWNAAQHKAQQVIVTVMMEPGSTLLSVRIENDGDLIPQEQWERIFMRGVSDRPDGSGHGLANRKQRLEILNGSIKVEMSSAQRTVFLVLLPGSET